MLVANYALKSIDAVRAKLAAVMPTLVRYSVP
jgi:hypothetical protein